MSVLTVGHQIRPTLISTDVVYLTQFDQLVVRIRPYLFLPTSVAEDRRRWTAITADASVGLPKRRLGVTGFD